MEQNRLQGEQIYLRPITAEDTERMIRWRNNPRVQGRLVKREPLTKEMHERWLREQVETGKVAQFIICEREGDRPVGSVYLRDIDREQGSAEYGILIGEDDATGRGYATVAARLALLYARETLQLSVVGLRVYTDNVAAIKSYEHAGFHLREVMKDVPSTDGTTADMYWMEVKLQP